jgi:CRISPR-associated protein Cas6
MDASGVDAGAAPPTMVDVAFALSGWGLPRSYPRALAEALARRLPWLAAEPDAGVHRINLAAGGAAVALLSGRSRLTLRVPRARVEALAALVGLRLDLGGEALHIVGAPQQRELLPHGTLYAHVVAAAGDDDEAAFLADVGAELAALGVAARSICGRLQSIGQGDQARPGYSLMLDQLAPEAALRVLERGIGPHRLWGCGLFVPHKSAAAVGH